MRRRFALVLLLSLSACEKTGPVEASELARVVSRLEKGAGAREAAEKRLAESSPYVTWKMLVPLIEKRGAAGEARAAAIRAVARSQQNLGLPGAVVRAAIDPDVAVRREAIRALVDLADPEFARALSAFAEGAKDPGLKKDLEAAVVAVKARERDWYRARISSAPVAEDRALAARTLSEIGNESDVPELISAFHRSGSDQLFHQEVILALSKIGGSDAKVFVREQLASEDRFMRGIAAFAETRLKDPEAVPALQALLAQEMVADTRVSAATALGLIATDAAKTALATSCTAGYPDKRVELACAQASKEAGSNKNR